MSDLCCEDAPLANAKILLKKEQGATGIQLTPEEETVHRPSTACLTLTDAAWYPVTSIKCQELLLLLGPIKELESPSPPSLPQDLPVQVVGGRSLQDVVKSHPVKKKLTKVPMLPKT